MSDDFLKNLKQKPDIFLANVQPKKKKIIVVLKNNKGQRVSGVSYIIAIKDKSNLNLNNIIAKESSITNSTGETKPILVNAYISVEVEVKINNKIPIAKDNKNGVYLIGRSSYSYISGSGNILGGRVTPKKREELVVEEKIIIEQKGYLLFKVFYKHGGKIINLPNTPYRIYDSTNKRIDANEKQIKPSLLQKNSVTHIIYTDDAGYIEVDFHGLKFKSRLQSALVTSTKGHAHTFEIKLSSTSTGPKETYTANLSGKKTLPIIIVPEKNEAYILPLDVFKPFDKLTKDFEKSISAIYKNRKDLELQLESKQPADIKKIEQRLGISKQEALEKINGEFKNAAEIQEVLVVEASGISNGNPNILRRYANKRTVADLRTQRINQSTTTLSVTNGSGANAREGTGEANAANPNQFKKSLNAFINGVGIELANYKSKSADEKSIRDLMLPVLGRVGGEYENQYNMMSENDELSVEAQWMRFVGTNGTEATLNLSKEHLHGKVEGKAAAKFVLFEGSANWNFFWPSKYGWNLVLDNGDPLATIRVVAGAALNGFAGANLAIAGQMGVAVGNVAGYQKLQALSHDPKQSMADAWDAVKGLKAEVRSNEEIPPDVLNKAQVEVKAFAGAQLALTPKVELQWFNANGNPRDSMGEPKFETLAKAAVTAGVSGGVGAEFNFYAYIHPNGSIRIKVSAHLCYGVGAKGAVDLEVNPKDLFSLMLFIKKNLLKLQFKKLIFIADNLFIQLSQFFAMMAAKNDYRFLNNYSKEIQSTAASTSTFFRDLSAEFRKWTNEITSEEDKLKCAQNINNNLKILIELTPNSKAILIYSLCHWNSRWAHIDDWPSFDSDGVHFLDQRKTAIVNIFKSIIHANEWKNVIERINAEGKKVTGEYKKLERHIVNFLAYGLNRVKFHTEDVIRALNSNTPYNGPTNQWIKDFVEARQKLEGIKKWPLEQIAYGQSDYLFKQAKIMQDLDERSELIYTVSSNDIPKLSDDDSTLLT